MNLLHFVSRFLVILLMLEKTVFYAEDDKMVLYIAGFVLLRIV